MTGKQRILAKLRGEPTDSLPLMPITMMFAADLAGVRYGDYARDHSVLADAQVAVADRFGFDHGPFVEALFDFTVRMEVEFARAQVEAGATLIGVGDAAASLIGPKLYARYVLPCGPQLIATIRALGVPVRLHICGNTKRIVEGMGQTGADIVDLDFLTPLGHARRAMRQTQVLLGNIDPVRQLRDGTPASVEAALAECYRQAGAAYICGAGCEAPRGTPHANLEAMARFARSRS